MNFLNKHEHKLHELNFPSVFYPCCKSHFVLIASLSRRSPPDTVLRALTIHRHRGYQGFKPHWRPNFLNHHPLENLWKLIFLLNNFFLFYPPSPGKNCAHVWHSLVWGFLGGFSMCHPFARAGFCQILNVLHKLITRYSKNLKYM